MAWPDAPLTKLSIAEKMTILFLCLVLHTEISQLFVFKTLPLPIGELIFFRSIKIFLKWNQKKEKIIIQCGSLIYNIDHIYNFG